MRTSENSVKWKSNFRECPECELRQNGVLGSSALRSTYGAKGLLRNGWHVRPDLHRVDRRAAFGQRVTRAQLPHIPIVDSPLRERCVEAAPAPPVHGGEALRWGGEGTRPAVRTASVSSKRASARRLMHSSWRSRRKVRRFSVAWVLAHRVSLKARRLCMFQTFRGLVLRGRRRPERVWGTANTASSAARPAPLPRSCIRHPARLPPPLPRPSARGAPPRRACRSTAPRQPGCRGSRESAAVCWPYRKSSAAPRIPWRAATTRKKIP